MWRELLGGAAVVTALPILIYCAIWGVARAERWLLNRAARMAREERDQEQQEQDETIARYRRAAIDAWQNH